MTELDHTVEVAIDTAVARGTTARHVLAGTRSTSTPEPSRPTKLPLAIWFREGGQEGTLGVERRRVWEILLCL